MPFAFVFPVMPEMVITSFTENKCGADVVMTMGVALVAVLMLKNRGVTCPSA